MNTGYWNPKYMFISSIIVTLFLSTSCTNVEGEWQNAQQSNTVEAYEAFIAEHPGAPQIDEARRRLAAAQAWRLLADGDDIDALRNFIREHGESGFDEPARSRLDALATKYALARITEKAEYAELSTPLADLLERADRDRTITGLDALAQRATLELVAEKIRISGQADFVIDAVQAEHWPDDYARDQSVGGIVAGAYSDTEAGRTLSLFSSHAPASGRVFGTIVRGRGEWLVGEVGSKRMGFPASLHLTRTDEGVLVSTPLPDEEILMMAPTSHMGGMLWNGAKASMSFSQSGGKLGTPDGNFVLPTGDGSRYCVRGSVENLAPGFVFEAEEGEVLCFGVIQDVGLSYLVGVGRVILPDQSTIDLPIQSQIL